MGLGRPSSHWRHEMKNQLGVIYGFAELLVNEADPADPRRADYQEILAAAIRAIELLKQSPSDD